ncbi:hypothetical protein KY336_02625 [Candidatus Woesearchaeota archaeon]|nr:hypothetical protein [Candidatus Woesearchaeota archaeon]
MKGRKALIWLLIIYLLVVAFRLYFSFQTPHFDYDAYFDLRQIEHIHETGLPLDNDLLSYGGRDFLFLPTFHYFTAFFVKFIPIDLTAKIIPNLLAASLVFIVFLIAKHMTKNNSASLFAAFIAGFIPIYIKETLNTVSPLSLLIPLIFLSLYCFMRLRKKSLVILFIVLCFLLPLTGLGSLILILVFFFFAVLAYLEKFSFKSRALELSLFFTIVSLWLIFLIFKEAFLVHGTTILYQNIPQHILGQYFKDITMSQAISGIGIIPLVIGSYVLFRYLFREKNNNVYLLAAFVISVVLLLWLKLITPALGLIFLGVILTILFSMFFNLFFEYVHKTKFSRYYSIFMIIFIVIFIATSVIPSVAFAVRANNECITQTEINTMLWLEEKTHIRTTILAPLKYGHVITAVAKRANIADKNFLLTDLPDQRISDIEEAYNTPSEINGLEIMDKYNAPYVLVPEGVTIKYLTENCFTLLHDGELKVYGRKCRPVSKRSMR